ncbi:hypothetical protein NEUTE2DRAFT_60744 [Neurospora tetrasperma FGSC 2509]|nr:hypothetical protein NEUTE2DRAFT_60744 [Neurospora tetrasperma FGSC 2509]
MVGLSACNQVPLYVKCERSWWTGHGYQDLILNSGHDDGRWKIDSRQPASTIRPLYTLGGRCAKRMSLKSAERTGIMPIGWSAVRQKVKLVLVARLPVAGDDRLNVTNTATLTESQWSFDVQRPSKYGHHGLEMVRRTLYGIGCDASAWKDRRALEAFQKIPHQGEAPARRLPSQEQRHGHIYIMLEMMAQVRDGAPPHASGRGDFLLQGSIDWVGTKSAIEARHRNVHNSKQQFTKIVDPEGANAKDRNKTWKELAELWCLSEKYLYLR